MALNKDDLPELTGPTVKEHSRSSITQNKNKLGFFPSPFVLGLLEYKEGGETERQTIFQLDKCTKEGAEKRVARHGVGHQEMMVHGPTIMVRDPCGIRRLISVSRRSSAARSASASASDMDPSAAPVTESVEEDGKDMVDMTRGCWATTSLDTSRAAFRRQT